jgi:hypothetical protein
LKGSIELVSNAANVAQQPIKDYIQAAVKAELPLDFLGTFLHEGTHFWCLDSPVGTAVAATIMQLHRECLSRPETLLFPSTAPIHSRVLAICKILEPLLEGLAQFAEFDLYPGDSSACSPIFLWMMKLFSQHADARLTSDSWAKLRNLLMMWRQSDQAIRRKCDVLVRPLTANNGGYLIGYLTVKNCWITARQHSDKLRDPDLFLMFLRSLIFDDHGLVEMLFKPQIDENDDANSLISHVDERLKLLTRDDVNERVTMFETAMEKQSSLDGKWAAIYVDDDCALRGKQKLANFIQSTASLAKENKSSVPTPESKIAIIDSGCLLSRQCFRIRTDSVHIKAADDIVTVVYEGTPLFIAQTCPGAPQGNYDGLLALYFLPKYMIPALVCISQNLTVCAYIPNNSSVKIDDATRQGVVGALSQALFAKDLRDNLNSITFTDDIEAVDLGEYQKFFPKLMPLVTDMYLNHALRFVPDSKLNSCRQIMAAQGFWNLLSQSKDSAPNKARRVRSLGTLGLVTSYIRNVTWVTGILAAEGFDFDQVVSDFELCNRDNGYPIIAKSTNSQNIMCFV